MEPAASPAAGPLPDGPLVLLTTRPRLRGDALAAAGWIVLPAADGPLAPRTAVVGSPADWQREWRALGELRAGASVLVDGCGPGDVRSLLGVAELLPPVSRPDDVVLVPVEGQPHRVRLPGGTGEAQADRAG